MRSSVSTRCEKVQEGLPALEKPCHSFLRHCTPTSRPYSHLRKRHEQVQYASKTGFFRSLLVDEYAEAAEQDPDGHRLYFILHPDSTAYIVAGPALELLDRDPGRLPAIFYHVFTGALNKWVRIYEYRDAEDRVEMLREWAVRTGNVRALPANRGSR